MKYTITFSYNIPHIGVRVFQQDYEYEEFDYQQKVQEAIIEIARTTPLSTKDVWIQIMGTIVLTCGDDSRNNPIAKLTIEALELATKQHKQVDIINKRISSFVNFLSRTAQGRKNKRKW